MPIRYYGTIKSNTRSVEELFLPLFCLRCVTLPSKGYGWQNFRRYFFAEFCTVLLMVHKTHSSIPVAFYVSELPQNATLQTHPKTKHVLYIRCCDNPSFFLDSYVLLESFCVVIVGFGLPFNASHISNSDCVTPCQ
jgi:hypothetical protein